MKTRTRMFAIESIDDILFVNQELRQLAVAKGFSNENIVRATLALCELARCARFCSEAPLLISILVNNDIRIEMEWSGPALVLSECVMVDCIQHITVDFNERRRRLLILEKRSSVA